MKKLFVIMVVLTAVSVYGQESVKVSVNGDVSYFSKNISLMTGLIFSEEPAMVAHMNMGINYKDFNLSVSYSGQLGIQHVQDGDRFNMLDLSFGYQLTQELSTCVGYELTYSDNIKKKDEIGHGVFAMATYNKKNLSSNLIFFADPKIQNTYYIASVKVGIIKNVNIYALGGYTNTKVNHWYGLFGIEYSKGNFSTGVYNNVGDSGPSARVSVNF